MPSPQEETNRLLAQVLAQLVEVCRVLEDILRKDIEVHEDIDALRKLR